MIRADDKTAYPFYVIRIHKNGSPEILSGWDYRCDADDSRKEFQEFNPDWELRIWKTRTCLQKGLNIWL